MVPEKSAIRLTFITSDERVPELIEACASQLGAAADTAYPPYDVTIEPLASGSKMYIEWVQE